jgi:16S rRNA (guanine(966)-N(2))-methyltransferase RsmD
MKDRVREATFNLIGPSARGKYVLDLFAGTGALGLEAISRGAARGALIEQHFPTVRIIEQNVATLGVAEQVEVVARSAFFWVRKMLDEPRQPWLVFCSPPYALYVERREEMAELIRSLYKRAPADSVLVVEADQRFDVSGLPDADCWDVREYPPAIIAIAQKQ